MTKEEKIFIIFILSLFILLVIYAAYQFGAVQGFREGLEWAK